MRRRDKNILLLCATVMAVLLLAVPALAQVRLNEIRTDNPGTDTDEYFEIKGPASTDLSGYTFIIIGDASSTPRCGSVEAVVNIGSLSSYTIPADGYYAVNRDAGAMTGYDVTGVTALNMENTDNVTFLLVQGWSGTLNMDLDTNDDGTLDSTPWTTLVDCVAIKQSTIAVDCTGAAATEHVYCATVVDGITVVPMMIWRCEDTGAWMQGDNSLPPTGVDSPGSANQTCTLPSPSIKMEYRSPCAPAVSQAVTVTDSVTGTPTSATIHYQINGGTDNTVAMSSIGSNKWQGVIPGQATNKTRISYYVVATNANGSDQGFNWGYFVGLMDVSDIRVNDGNGSNIYRYYGVNLHGNCTSANGTFVAGNTDFYFQDGTGGIDAFQFGKIVAAPVLGDDVDVSGEISQYNGNLEVAQATVCGDLVVTINGAGTTPAATLVSTCDVGEATEGLLVHLQYPQVDTTTVGSYGGLLGGKWKANRNYLMTNCYPDTVILFIDADTDVDGTPVPTAMLDLTGICTQYDTTVPYLQKYEVSPRALTDLKFVYPADVTEAVLGLKARLFPSAPNPFHSSTKIGYQVPKSGAAAVPVRINLYDVAGRKVATLVDGLKEPGAYSLTLDASQLSGASSGIFFYELVIDGKRIESQKLVLSR